MLSCLCNLESGYKITSTGTGTDLMFQFKPCFSLITQQLPLLSVTIFTLLVIFLIHVAVLDNKCVVQITQKSPIHLFMPLFYWPVSKTVVFLKQSRVTKYSAFRSICTNKISYTFDLLCSKYHSFGGFGWDGFGNVSSLIKSNEEDQ